MWNYGTITTGIDDTMFQIDPMSMITKVSVRININGTPVEVSPGEDYIMRIENGTPVLIDANKNVIYLAQGIHMAGKVSAEIANAVENAGLGHIEQVVNS